ncbi:MFS transporter [Streptococcus suis]|uniref:Lantibiotic efflux protein n=1 Tax=Streptococcus suis TaxID=1307 RepID=A0A0Z8X405_STRSU|nr:MFS transporter [Streptococcus suis]NQR96969.1 MFS transporter [Streptococcus suis]QZT29226.1 MFS transporter [Streptococcus suis]CYX85433.1 lantibiotic efflux protein [Streptococcus suis]HEM3165580.1 MFS transporter [Streptococcus suis 92-1191]HEM6182838.1 MFS transporter [Streptococcus suis]
MKKILKNTTYLWVLTADMLSNFGDVVYYLALMNYVLLVPNSRLALAIVTFSEIFPSFMGLFTGYLADKTVNKIGTIKLTLLFRVVLYLILGFCMGFEPALWIVVVAATFNVFADFAGFYENGLYTPLGLRVAPKEEREQYSAFRKLLTEQPLKIAEQPSQTEQKTKGPGILASFKQAIVELRKIPEFRLVLITNPLINACGAILYPILVLLISEDPDLVFLNVETTLALTILIFFIGHILGSTLVFTLFKKTSMVTLEVAATFSLLGVFVGMLLHQLPIIFFFLTTMGISSGASGPKFNAKFVNSMPEEQLATIGGAVSTYFMLGQAFTRLLVSGLVLVLTVDQISGLFLTATGLLVLYVFYWLARNQKTPQNQSV